MQQPDIAIQLVRILYSEPVCRIIYILQPEIDFPSTSLGVDDLVYATRERIDELEEKYYALVSATQKVVTLKAPSVEEFRRRITLLPKSRKREQRRYLEDHLSYISHAESIDEIFSCLNLHVWDYLNFGLLDHIVAVYGDAETKQKMEEYVMSVQSFRKDTPVHIFLKAQPEAECASIPPNLRQNLQKVAFKHHSLSSSSSLEDFEFVRQEIAREFSLPDFVMILVGIEPGSIVTTWLLPVTLVAMLKDEIQQGKLPFLQQKDVLEVIFADSKVCSSG